MQDQYKTTSAEGLAIVTAVKEYLTKTGTPVTNPDVAIDKVMGSFARVRITAPGGEADAIYGFVKQEQGVWSVLDLGTFFEPGYYDQHGVPKAIRL